MHVYYMVSPYLGHLNIKTINYCYTIIRFMRLWILGGGGTPCIIGSRGVAQTLEI